MSVGELRKEIEKCQTIDKTVTKDPKELAKLRQLLSPEGYQAFVDNAKRVERERDEARARVLRELKERAKRVVPKPKSRM